MPHYEAGLHEDAAREAFGAEDVVKLASNESPWGPHPGGGRGDRRRPRRASTATRTSTPARCAGGSPSASRSSRPGSRSATAPARSCSPRRRRCASPATRSCSRGRRSRSTRTSRRSREPGRSACRSPRATSTTSTRCSPRSPRRPSSSASATPTTRPARTCRPTRIAAFCERVPRPRHGRARRGLHRVPDQRRPRRHRRPAQRFPNLVLLRTFSKVYGLAGLRCGYALCSAKFRAAVDAVRQPFSVNELAQAAAAEAIMHGDDVARAGRADDRGARLRRGGSCGSWASTRRTRRPTSPGSPSATATRPRSSSSLGERGDRGPRRRRASAARATSASPTARAARTSASSRRSASGLVSAELLDYLRRHLLQTQSMNRASTSGLPHRSPGRAAACMVLLLAI